MCIAKTRFPPAQVTRWTWKCRSRREAIRAGCCPKIASLTMSAVSSRFRAY